MFKNARVYIQTLGCPKNEVDSEIIRGSLESEGFRICSDPEEADIVIVNSCGFIQEAKEESIQTTLSLAAMKNENKSRKLILYGCLGQRYRRELEKLLPEVDAIFGVEEIDSLVNYCRNEKTIEPEGEKRFSSDYVEYPRRKIAADRPYAYLKISEGCDNHCSYCAIPGIRGPLRSRLIENVIKEAQTLVDSGVKEIILIAQDTTSYGVDVYGSPELVRLLREISGIENLGWIRILYAQPRGVDEKLIREISENEKICKYIDLPLQHISDKILRRMNRKVTKKQICDLIERVRIAVPGVALRTTLIVGFPGETEANFQELLDFAQEVCFDQLGAFAYSREEGTEAYDFSNQVPRRIREQRLDLLMRLQSDIIFRANEKRVGEEFEVLVEGREEAIDGRWVCRSEHQAPEIDNCFLTTGLNLKAGDFVRVKVVGQEVYDLVAELEEPRRSGNLRSRALRTSG